MDRYRDPIALQAAASVTKPHYVRLPGKARALATTSTLWLGEDHILLVKSTRVVEDYRRFYLRDVQAITVRRTMPFHFGWAALLFLLVLLIARFSRSAPITLMIVAASVVCLWARGPACVCHLYTAVRKERLPSLHRWRTAGRVLEMLRARIEEDQGTVVPVPEVVPSTGPPPLPGPPSLPGTPPLPSAPLQPASAMPHFALFSALLLSSALAGFALLEPVSWTRTAIPIASLLEFLCFVPVLMWQTVRRFSNEVKALTWAAVGRWFLVQAAAWILQYKAAIVDRTTRDISPLAVPLGVGWIGWFNFVSLLVIGLAGLWFTIVNARSNSYVAEGHTANG